MLIGIELEPYSTVLKITHEEKLREHRICGEIIDCKTISRDEFKASFPTSFKMILKEECYILLYNVSFQKTLLMKKK